MPGTRLSTLLPPLLLAVSIAAGCGRDPTPVGRIKLVDVPDAKLRAAPDRESEPPRTLLEEDFRAGPMGWSAVEDVLDPSRAGTGSISASPETDGETTFLSLRGHRGFAIRTVPIRPGRAHRLAGRFRTRGVVRKIGEEFRGARFILIEVGGEPDSEELRLRRGWLERETGRRVLPILAEEEWGELELDFATDPDTRWLVLCCELGVSEEVGEGRVDLTGIELREVPWKERWERDVSEVIRAHRPGDPVPEGWRGRRLVSASLLYDLRPSVIHLPGESLLFTIRVPSGEPVFRAGVGPWSGELRIHRGRRMELALRIGGETAHVVEQAVPERFLDCPWTELEVDLSPWRGQTVELELAGEGDVACVWGSPTIVDRQVEPERPNVILVSIDTVRADHMGVYGYALDTTPNIDRFAHSAILFEDMTAQAPYTLPSHVSMFSGQFPSVHGVQGSEDRSSSARTPALAEILGEYGYYTKAIVGGGYVSARFGFDRGFDSFLPIDPIRHRHSWFFETWIEERPEQMSPELADRLLVAELPRWLREDATEPFFLFVHTYAVHAFESPPEYLEPFEEECTTDWNDIRPYVHTGLRNNDPLSEEQAAHLVHCYDASLRYTDEMIGRLLDLLKEIGIDERTIVVLTSDHGKEILDRGSIQHGRTLYGELVQVPLIVRIPDTPARTIEAPAMHIDLAPTILAALGIPADPRMQGMDLLGAEPRPSRTVWSEVDTDLAMYALRDPGGWKLIHRPSRNESPIPDATAWELYDLHADPDEQQDLSRVEEQRLKRMQQTLLDLRSSLERLGESLGAAGESELDEQTKEQLIRLGYF